MFMLSRGGPSIVVTESRASISCMGVVRIFVSSLWASLGFDLL